MIKIILSIITAVLVFFLIGCSDVRSPNMTAYVWHSEEDYSFNGTVFRISIPEDRENDIYRDIFVDITGPTNYSEEERGYYRQGFMTEFGAFGFLGIILEEPENFKAARAKGQNDGANFRNEIEKWYKTDSK